MSRRDPIAYGLVLLGFGSTYTRAWLPRLVPSYTDWHWWQQGILRLVCVGISSLAAWWIISWRLTQPGHAEAGAYWAMWSMGVIAGLVIDEIHSYVDSMFT